MAYPFNIKVIGEFKFKIQVFSANEFIKYHTIIDSPYRYFLSIVACIKKFISPFPYITHTSDLDAKDFCSSMEINLRVLLERLNIDKHHFSRVGISNDYIFQGFHIRFRSKSIE